MRRKQVVTFLKKQLTRGEVDFLREDPGTHRIQIVTKGTEFMWMGMKENGQLYVIVTNRKNENERTYDIDPLEIV